MWMPGQRKSRPAPFQAQRGNPSVAIRGHRRSVDGSRLRGIGGQLHRGWRHPGNRRAGERLSAGLHRSDTGSQSGVVVGDLVSGSVVDAAGQISLSVRLRAGTFDPQTTEIDFEFDVDQDASTGSDSVNRPGGIEYIISMGSAYNRGGVWVFRYQNGNWLRTPVSSTPTFREDGIDVTVPAAVLGSPTRPINVRVLSSTQLSASTFTPIMDYMPDSKLAMAPVQ